MTPTERRLFTDLLGALAERFSGAGHVMQQIEWEHRGHCPPRECCMRCQTYSALLCEASEALERELTLAAPRQPALFGADAAGGG